MRRRHFAGYKHCFCTSGVVPLSKLRSCGVPKQN